MTTVQSCPTHDWCTGEHINGLTLPLHQGARREVGPQPRQHTTGIAAAWLRSGRDGPVKVEVQVAHMVSASVVLSVGHAREFRDLLTQLIDQAEPG